MVKHWIGAAAMLLAAPAAAQIAEDSQLFLQLSASGQISGRLGGYLEVQPRFDRNIGRFQQLFVRPALTYAVTDRVTLWLGFQHILSDGAGAAQTTEERLWQQVNWTVGTLAGGTIALRTRAEQRWLSGSKDVGYRLRQRLAYVAPLRVEGKTAIVTTFEPYFALNDTDYGAVAGLDQFRTFVGLSFPAGDDMTIETGYLNRYTNRTSGRSQIDHIASLSLAVRL